MLSSKITCKWVITIDPEGVINISSTTVSHFKKNVGVSEQSPLWKCPCAIFSFSPSLAHSGSWRSWPTWMWTETAWAASQQSWGDVLAWTCSPLEITAWESYLLSSPTPQNYTCWTWQATGEKYILYKTPCLSVFITGFGCEKVRVTVRVATNCVFHALKFLYLLLSVAGCRTCHSHWPIWTWRPCGWRRTSLSPCWNSRPRMMNGPGKKFSPATCCPSNPHQALVRCSTILMYGAVMQVIVTPIVASHNQISN